MGELSTSQAEKELAQFLHSHYQQWVINQNENE